MGLIGSWQLAAGQIGPKDNFRVADDTPRMCRARTIPTCGAFSLLGLKAQSTISCLWKESRPVCRNPSTVQFPFKAYPKSNGSLPSTRNTFTELLIEYTFTIPTAPGVASTVRSKSVSPSTIFTTWRN